jgi:hypothetical protein
MFASWADQVDTDKGEWDDSFNADCLAKVFCPPNTTKSQELNISGAKHAPGHCTQSWTLACVLHRTSLPCLPSSSSSSSTMVFPLDLSVVSLCAMCSLLIGWSRYSDEGELMPFMGGNLGIWTLFDYLGEPSSSNRAKEANWEQPNWPQVSCNFGSFDLSGFTKPAAYHYRSWWLANLQPGDVSRPPVSDGQAIGARSNTSLHLTVVNHRWCSRTS